VRNKQTKQNSKINQRSHLAVKYELFAVVVVYLLLAGGGGNSEAKVIGPKWSSCLEGAGQQLVCSILPPPPLLIQNEWWGCVGQGQEGGLCPGDTERLSVAERLDTPQAVGDGPDVVIKRAIKL